MSRADSMLFVVLKSNQEDPSDICRCVNMLLNMLLLSISLAILPANWRQQCIFFSVNVQDETCVHVCQLDKKQTSAGGLQQVVQTLWLLSCVAGCCLAQCACLLYLSYNAHITALGMIWLAVSNKMSIYAEKPNLIWSEKPNGCHPETKKIENIHLFLWFMTFFTKENTGSDLQNWYVCTKSWTWVHPQEEQLHNEYIPSKKDEDMSCNFYIQSFSFPMTLCHAPSVFSLHMRCTRPSNNPNLNHQWQYYTPRANCSSHPTASHPSVAQSLPVREPF